MERLLVLNSVLLLVLGMAALGLWLGRHSNRPPGQKGVAGTPWERHEGLRRAQLVLLGLLALGCLLALVYVNR